MGKVLQVVDDDGTYQQDAVEAFVREQDLDSAGVDYQIVAIMGPQSSGKSTLMNAVVSPHSPPTLTNFPPTQVNITFCDLSPVSTHAG